MFYKKALDSLGLKGLLDYKQDKDWFSEILNDPQQTLINRRQPWIDFSGPAARRTEELASLLQNVRDRSQFPKNYAPGKIQASSVHYYTQPISGSAYVTADKKDLHVGSTATHPGILAHQIGHTAQKNTAGSSRRVQALASVPAAWLTAIIKHVRSKLNKDYDPSKFDATDKTVAAGAGAISGLAAWIAGTNVIKSQLNASGRGLRYLRNATYADIPQSLKLKGVDYSKIKNPIFGPRVLKQSRTVLRNALKTYKKGRIISAILHTATPVATSYLDALLRRHQKNKAAQLQAQK